MKHESIHLHARCGLPGCTGALAREVAKAFPSSSVAVFDLPHVVEMAQKHFAQDEDTIAFQAGEYRTTYVGFCEANDSSKLHLQPRYKFLSHEQEISSATSFLLLICTFWAESFTTGPKRSV